MEKKLTLNQTWTLCLKQWKWIIDQPPEGLTEPALSSHVWLLKVEWLKEHGYGYAGMTIWNDCFFCERARQQSGKDGGEGGKLWDEELGICLWCPGRLISKQFNCMNISYDFSKEPRRFYKKLLEGVSEGSE